MKIEIDIDKMYNILSYVVLVGGGMYSIVLLSNITSLSTAIPSIVIMAASVAISGIMRW